VWWVNSSRGVQILRFEHVNVKAVVKGLAQKILLYVKRFKTVKAVETRHLGTIRENEGVAGGRVVLVFPFRRYYAE
jgi:hypothetical protein